VSKFEKEPQKSGLLGNGPHGVSCISASITTAQLAKLETLNQCYLCRVFEPEHFFIISQPRMNSKTFNYVLLCKKCGGR